MSITANFELGVDTNRVLAADAGSATQWDAVNSNTATNASRANIIYENTQARGTLSAEIRTGGSPGTSPYMEWVGAFGSNTDHYGRCYVYLSAYHGAGFLVFVRAHNGVSIAAGVRMTTAGLIDLFDSGGTSRATGSVALALNQWVRIEYRIIHSGTVGQVHAKLFNTADSTSPDETISTTAAWNTLTSADRIRFGNNGAAASLTFYMDDILADADDWPGPSVSVTEDPFPYVAGGYFPTQG